MFINVDSIDTILRERGLFLAPANDLSKIFLRRLSKEQINSFVSYIDSTKKGQDIINSDVIEKEDVVILSSPQYWREIASGLKSEYIYLNTINGLINVNDYIRLVDGNKYFDFVIDASELMLHDDALEVAGKIKGKFHSIAIISAFGDDGSGFHFLDKSEDLIDLSCYISVSLNSDKNVKSKKSISVFYSATDFQNKPSASNDEPRNILHFSGYKPCRETVLPGARLSICDNYLSSHQRSDVIARDAILIAHGNAFFYRDFKTSVGYQMDCNYLSPNKYYHYDDSEETDGWQLEIYLFALGLMVKNDFKTVADIGCGSGYKLVNYLKNYDTIGIELSENVAYLKKIYPARRWLESDFSLKTEIDVDVIIFSDVIEHLVDPDLALAYIKNQNFKYLIISTPAREFLYKESEPYFYGPPRNPAHQREWTMDEFRIYIEKHFFVLDQRLTNYEQATQMIICKKV